MQGVQLRRTTRERDRANRERDRATRITDFMTGMFKVSDRSEARGNSITARPPKTGAADPGILLQVPPSKRDFSPTQTSFRSSASCKSYRGNEECRRITVSTGVQKTLKRCSFEVIDTSSRDIRIFKVRNSCDFRTCSDRTLEDFGGFAYVAFRKDHTIRFALDLPIRPENAFAA